MCVIWPSAARFGKPKNSLCMGPPPKCLSMWAHKCHALARVHVHRIEYSVFLRPSVNCVSPVCVCVCGIYMCIGELVLNIKPLYFDSITRLVLCGERTLFLIRIAPHLAKSTSARACERDPLTKRACARCVQPRFAASLEPACLYMGSIATRANE